MSERRRSKTMEEKVQKVANRVRYGQKNVGKNGQNSTLPDCS